MAFYCLAPAAPITAATPASAEVFADLYLGAAYTVRSDVTLTVSGASGAQADHVFHEVKWASSEVIGARVGYWFESAPWYGIGLDLFQFKPDIPIQTVQATIQGATAPATLQTIEFSTTAFAFDVLRFRYPLLVSPEFPKGRLRPYATLGPALFRTHVRNVANGEFNNRPATDSAWGFKAGAGLSWQLTRYAALFGEYRFTHFRAEPVLSGASGRPIPMRTDIDTHHLVAGASFSF